jgi:hypothetical protein
MCPYSPSYVCPICDCKSQPLTWCSESKVALPSRNNLILYLLLFNMAHEGPKKAEVTHLDYVSDAEKNSQKENDNDIVITAEERKKILWHIDRRLVSMAGLMYCISLMDRTNLGAAVIAGFVKPIQRYR